MAQPAPQIVGRTAELASLDQALTDLSQRGPAVIVLVGEPGIGKTRLLAELGARADALGHAVLAGSASELEGGLPFGIFVDALDEYVHALHPVVVDGLDADVRAELHHVLPSADGSSRAVPTLQIERYRIHRAVRMLLETISRDKPLVLLLDDLHWADSGSIELLGALLGGPPAGPVLLALAVRPRQAPTRLSAALERARRSGWLIRLDVEALDVDDAHELLGGAISRGEAVTLHTESGGNPFYLQELARASPQNAGGRPGAGARRARRSRRGRSGAGRGAGDARRLRAAGPAGRSGGGRPVRAGAGVGCGGRARGRGPRAAGRSAPARPGAPDRRPSPVPLPPSAGAAGDLSGGARRLAAGRHDRAATVLAALGAPAPARAHHVEHAGRYGDAAAIAVLRQAGEAVAAQAPAGAARWFAAVLRLLPDAAPGDERIALLTALAGAQAAVAQSRTRTPRCSSACGSRPGRCRSSPHAPASRS